MTWILTHSGEHFDLLSPQPGMVKLLDIAHALAHTARFNGHTAWHYSVAQHSLLVASLVPAEHQLVALLHDATEAYLGDVTRPLKLLLDRYQQLERRVWHSICARFSLNPIIPDCIHEADRIALVTERRDLMPRDDAHWECRANVSPSPSRIGRWSPEKACNRFYARAIALLAARDSSLGVPA